MATCSSNCLENSIDRGAWWAIVHGVAESDTPEQLSTHASVMVATCLWLAFILNYIFLSLCASILDSVYKDKHFIKV